jgi:hypothetical protein
MRRATLTVDGCTHELAPDTDVDGLRESIEQAVRHGGGFVTVTVAESVAVSVLVTPGASILLITRDAVDGHDGTAGATAGFDVTEWEIRVTV